MRDKRLPILQTALLGWQDGFRALLRMPNLAVVACGVSYLQYVVARLLWPGKSVDKPISIEMLDFGFGVLASFFLVPVAIAVHRYVLLGEATNSYALDPTSYRFKNFFLFGVLLQAIFIPSALFGGSPASIVPICISLFISTRLIMLFPAIAIDGYGTNVLTAWQFSSGCFWRIFVTIVMSFLPAFLVAMAFVSLSPPERGLDTPAMAILSGPIGAMFVFIAPALASHLYRALVQQADHPAQP